jgi:hypothetical protein
VLRRDRVLMSVAATASLLVALALSSTGEQTERVVRSTEELQAAIDAATAGQTIALAPGQTYSGHLRLPAWRGGDPRPIVIRTSGTDAVPAGTRLTPERATKLAKLQSPDNAPVLSTSPGARYWRIELVEFLANRSEDSDIIALGGSQTNQTDPALVPADLVLDRVYIHGDRAQGQKRGIALNSGRTTISNSYIADIKSVGVDSQAIAGWNGPGDYVIENNYLESAGENIMFGGADPATPGLTPTGIVIRRNTLSKPVAWRQMRWQVKNLLELKNARQVRIEDNLFERNWAQAQSGYAVLFTVRNQDGGCPWCQVEDVRFERNVVRDVAAGISILGDDDAHPSRRTSAINISYNLFNGVDSREWGGDGYMLQLLRDPSNIVVDHNTLIQGQSGGIVKIEGVVPAFQFTNNIAAHGSYGFIATDHGPGNDTIRAALPGAIIRSNVIAGGNEGDYPPGNLFPSLQMFRQQFVDFSGGNFRLRPNSQWARASTTGGLIGAELVNPPAQTPVLGPRAAAQTALVPHAQ